MLTYYVWRVSWIRWNGDCVSEVMSRIAAMSLVENLVECELTVLSVERLERVM